MLFTPAQLSIASQVIQEGGKRWKLATRLGISPKEAKLLMDTLERGEVVSKKPLIRELLAEQAPLYDIAVDAELSMTSVRTEISKAQGTYCPAEDDLRKAVALGASFGQLSRAFGFRNVQEAVDRILPPRAGESRGLPASGRRGQRCPSGRLSPPVLHRGSPGSSRDTGEGAG